MVNAKCKNKMPCEQTTAPREHYPLIQKPQWAVSGQFPKIKNSSKVNMVWVRVGQNFGSAANVRFDGLQSSMAMAK